MGKVDFTRKVSIIGAGNVGATAAYALLLSRICSEIAIVDINKDKAYGEALDLKHATSFSGHVKVYSGEYSACADSDVIVLCAGVGRKPGQTRIDLAKTNISIARDVMGSILKYNKDPLLLVVSNPVDIITYVLKKEYNLSANRVFGTGTSLDTARFKSYLGESLNISPEDADAFIIGEHGDSQVPIWSSATAAGAPIVDMLNNAGISREDIFNQVRTSGAKIISGKSATFYGISSVIVKILSGILGDQNIIMPLSKVMDSEMGISDVALSMPYVVNKNGIDRMVSISMDEKELAAFASSAEKLKEAIKDQV
ncbi:MAG: L-lactate dehydrogenase [Eubacteriales bacterium]